MYVYQSYDKRKKKVNWLLLLATFLVALGGSYFSQVYLKNIWGAEEVAETPEVEKLSYEETQNQIGALPENRSENMIERVTQSVVGINKLQANEESLFDVSLSQKWGLRDRNYRIREWIYLDQSAFGW